MHALLVLFALVAARQDDVPSAAERLRRIQSLMRQAEESLNDADRRAQGHQREAIKGLDELIREAMKAAQGRAAQARASQVEPGRVQRPGVRADRTYPTERRDPPAGSRFLSRGTGTGWGAMNPKDLAAAMSAWRDADAYPADYQQALKEYFDELSK
jgi:hypothetical protein